MKKLYFLALLLTPFLFFGQAPNAVKWEAKYNELANGEGEIVITGTVEKGWHTYSMFISQDVAPIATIVTFSPGSNYEMIGKATEEGAKEEFDKMFDAKIASFEHKAIIKQKVKRKNLKEFQTPLRVEFIACNNSQCLPPKTIDIMLVVPPKK